MVQTELTQEPPAPEELGVELPDCTCDAAVVAWPVWSTCTARPIAIDSQQRLPSGATEAPVKWRPSTTTMRLRSGCHSPAPVLRPEPRAAGSGQSHPAHLTRMGHESGAYFRGPGARRHPYALGSCP